MDYFIAWMTSKGSFWFVSPKSSHSQLQTSNNNNDKGNQGGMQPFSDYRGNEWCWNFSEFQRRSIVVDTRTGACLVTSKFCWKNWKTWEGTMQIPSWADREFLASSLMERIKEMNEETYKSLTRSRLCKAPAWALKTKLFHRIFYDL